MHTRVILGLLLLIGCGAQRPPSPPPGGSEGSFARSANQLGLDMWGRLDGTGNQVFSPASIAVALDMTYAGARGETAAQMARVLHIDDGANEALHASAGEALAGWNDPSREAYTLAVANRLFGEQTYTFGQPFLDLTASTYRAPLEPVDFRGDPEAARGRINTWVAEQTRDRIAELVPIGALTPSTRLVLTNAVYFYADWAEKFDRDATRDAPFFASGTRSVDVPTMHHIGQFRYAEVDGAQVLEMPYAGGEIAMSIVLPRDRAGLPALEARMTEATMADWIGALSERAVAIALPKFRIEPAGSIALASVLGELGMPRAFSPDQADFGGMADGLYISEVFHQAFVAVDEDGTEAAAATAVVMEDEAETTEPESVAFTADHPFLFFIRDLRSGVILFMGRLDDPS
jgi:serpin B